MQELDKHVKDLLNERIVALEEYFDGDCIFYYGLIFPSLEKRFRQFIELLQEDGNKPQEINSFSQHSRRQRGNRGKNGGTYTLSLFRGVFCYPR